jgi:rfaE bifunctional protein nucleotidyltransferase chain/domain
MVSVSAHDKIISLKALASWREPLRRARRTLVVTNGCFDLLHAGHVTYLEAARNQGDVLLVGLNSDASVRALKGKARPVNPEQDRALVLAALAAVDAVCIFPDRRATGFLRLAQPDVYVKGGDYTLDTLDPEERLSVQSSGGKVVILPLVPGKSTTSLLARIALREPPRGRPAPSSRKPIKAAGARSDRPALRKV